MKLSSAFLTAALHLWAATACLTETELNGAHIVDLTKRDIVLTRQSVPGNDSSSNSTVLPVAATDRFGNGDVPPRGLGSRPAGDPAVIDRIMSLAEVKSAIKALERRFPRDVRYFEAPHKTYENRTVFGAKVAGKRSNASTNRGYSVLLQSGLHPRERGGPDSLLYFAADLLFARAERKGLRYGGMAYSAGEVEAALDQGIVLLPAANPDGMAFDQATDACWRKNRNPASASPGDPHSVGVDLNRNFDVLWDFERHLAPGVPAASSNASDETFHGTAAFSEPETRNVRWALDTFRDVSWLADLHSAAGVVLHGWCHDTTQARDPAQSFRDPRFDGKRGVIPDAPGVEYQEFMDRRDWDALTVTSARIAGAMSSVLGFVYPSFQATALGSSTGCSTDHAYSRHIVDPGRSKVLGFGIEFGRFNEAAECPFYPNQEIFTSGMLETGAGLMELLLAADRS